MAGFTHVYGLFQAFKHDSHSPHASLQTSLRLIKVSFQPNLRPLSNLEATKFVTRTVTFSVEPTSYVNHFSRSLESNQLRNAEWKKAEGTRQ